MRGRAALFRQVLAVMMLLAAPQPGFPAADTVPPHAVKVVRPEYPKAAVSDEIEGWVDVDITVAADGTVRDVKVVEADPPQVFDRAATRAVARWVFEPARTNGVAVEAHVREHILFQP